MYTLEKELPFINAKHPVRCLVYVIFCGPHHSLTYREGVKVYFRFRTLRSMQGGQCPISQLVGGELKYGSNTVLLPKMSLSYSLANLSPREGGREREK